MRLLSLFGRPYSFNKLNNQLMKTTNLIALTVGLFCVSQVQAQEPMKMKPEMTEFWDPEVTVVTPGAQPSDAPSDATVLFDGTPGSLTANWVGRDGNAPKWNVLTDV